MLYTELKVKDTIYKLRLNARNCVDLEKKLGTNPLNVLMQLSDGNSLPELGVMLDILHASLQAFEHGISAADVDNIYDEWIDDGHTFVDLVPIIVDVFKVSGFFKEDDKIKNAKKRVAEK